MTAVSSVYGQGAKILAWDESVAQRKLAWVAGEKLQLIEDLSERSRTSRLPMPAEGKPMILRALDTPSATAKPPLPHTDMVIPNPQGITRPLILLLPDKKAATGLRLLVVDDSQQGFGWGSAKIFNTFGANILIKCGEKVARLPANWTPVLVRPDLKPDAATQVQMAFEKEANKLLYDSVWNITDQTRILAFIIKPEDLRQGELGVKMISESREQAALENKAAQTNP